MKHTLKRGASFFLAIAMTLTSSSALSNTLGDSLRTQTIQVAPAVSVTDQTLWSDDYGDLRTEHFIEYTPNDGVTPIVSYGSYVRSRETMDTMAAKLEASGLRVAAGINTASRLSATALPRKRSRPPRILVSGS